MFFPVGSTRSAMQQAFRAKTICGGCPVSAACLRWAIDAGVDHGVWGGMSEEERRNLKRRTTRGRNRAA